MKHRFRSCVIQTYMQNLRWYHTIQYSTVQYRTEHVAVDQDPGDGGNPRLSKVISCVYVCNGNAYRVYIIAGGLLYSTVCMHACMHAFAHREQPLPPPFKGAHGQRRVYEYESMYVGMYAGVYCRCVCSSHRLSLGTLMPYAVCRMLYAVCRTWLPRIYVAISAHIYIYIYQWDFENTRPPVRLYVVYVHVISAS